MGRGRRRHPSQAGQVSQPHPGPALRGGPALHTGDGQIGRVLLHGQQHGPRRAATASWPPPRESRQVAPVAAGRSMAATAVRLIWKSFGPAAVRAAPGDQQGGVPGHPADALTNGQDGDEERSAPDQGQRSPAADGGRGGRRCHEPVGVQGLRLRGGQRGAQLCADRPRPEAPHHGGELEGHVDDEAHDEDPRPEVVGGVEAEPEDVVVLDVQDAGDHLEHDPADDHDERQPLEHVGHRPQLEAR